MGIMKNEHTNTAQDEHEFNRQREKRTLSTYDECSFCNKEDRLLDGLCFDCWKEKQLEQKSWANVRALRK